MTFLALYVRILLGGVFLLSALTKLVAPRQFVQDVHAYRMLPRPLASAFAWLLPYFELGAAAWLLSGYQAAWAALAVVGMLVTFMAAVGVAMARGLDLSCACFGLLYRERVGWATQGRDGVLLLMAVLIILLDNGSLTIGGLAADLTRIGYAVGIGATSVAIVFSVAIAILTLRRNRQRNALHGHAPEQTPGNGATLETGEQLAG